MAALEAITPRDPKGRYPLHYILMEDGRLVASDGAVLASVEADGFGQRAMYNMGEAARLFSDRPVTLKKVDGGVDAEQGDLTLHMRCATEEDEMMRGYPPYRDMIDGEPEGNSTVVAIGLLRKLLDVCEAAGNTAIRLTVPEDPTDVVHVMADDRRLTKREEGPTQPVRGAISPVVDPDANWREE